jgi:phosphoserine phosphatase RsbU/P
MSGLAGRILVIDRNEVDLRRLTEYLAGKGYVVHGARTLQQAREIAATHPPDLVFADVTNAEIPHIPLHYSHSLLAPLVVVSYTEKAGDVVACLRKGAADYILKPVRDFASVDDVIHRILDKIRLAKLNQRLQLELEEGNRKLRAGIQELRADQKAGLQVQLRMLPPTPKVIHDVHFEHSVRPSLYLSGDFLDYFNLDDDKLLFYFADVSGHGASSAFVTVLLKNLAMRLRRNFKRGSSDEISCPAKFLKRVNQELLTTDLGKHVTIFAGVIDRQHKTLTYAVGGHFPLPILCGAGQAEYLSGKGVAVGLLPEPEFDVHTRALPDGFQITVFSDGILEVIAGPGLQDKENLLLDVVSAQPRGIESLLSSLGLDEIEALPDDIAVLTVSDAALRLGDGS